MRFFTHWERYPEVSNDSLKLGQIQSEVTGDHPRYLIHVEIKVLHVGDMNTYCACELYCLHIGNNKYALQMNLLKYGQMYLVIPIRLTVFELHNT